MSLTTQARVYDQASATISARLEDRPQAYLTPGAPFTQSQVASVSLTILDVATGMAVAGFAGIPLTVASVIFNTLQPWAPDARGCNFVYTLAPGAFPSADKEYRVEVQFTLTDGRVGFAVWDVTTEQSL